MNTPPPDMPGMVEQSCEIILSFFFLIFPLEKHNLFIHYYKNIFNNFKNLIIFKGLSLI